MATEMDTRCVMRVIRDPLRSSIERHVVPCAAGQWLREAVPADCLHGEWVAVDGGRVITQDEWDRYLVVPGADIVLYPRVSGVVGLVMVGLMLASVAVQTVMAMTAKPTLPNIPSGSSQMAGSPTYGFGGLQNSTRVGAPIPVVYGLHRVGGHILNMFVETLNDNDVIHMLLAVSEGEVLSIEGLEINEQPIDNYTSVSMETRNGLNSQTAIGLYGDKSAVTIGADAAVTTSYLLYTTEETHLNGFIVKVIFPGGLYQATDQGSFVTASVIVEVDYKLTSSGTWTTGPRVTYTHSTRTVLRREIRVDGLTSGQYDIRVRRTTVESTAANRVDAVRRDAVTELTNDHYTYPNTALVAVKAVATNQLSGGLPRVTALVFGVKVKVFGPTLTYTMAWSDNPAWIVFDILTNARYGYGRFMWKTLYTQGGLTVTSGSVNFSGTGTGWTSATLRVGQVLHDPVGQAVGIVKTINYGAQTGTFELAWGGASRTNGAYEVRSNDLDILSFVWWSVFCLEFVPNGTGGTGPRVQCNMVFDADRETVWAAISRICTIGRAALVKVGNYLRVKIESVSAPVQLFTMANIKKESFTEIFLPLKERFNLFEVQFLNEGNRYQQDVVTIEDPLLFTNSEQPRRKTISGYGITRSDMAERLALFHQRHSRHVTRTITFEAGLDAVACEPGDVIRFQHDVPQWGYGGRVAPGSTASTIVLDREVTLEGGRSYEVLVRYSNDQVETRVVTVGAGTWSTLTVSPDWGPVPADGDVWAFGEQLISTKPFRVVTIERTQELNAKITAVEYSDAIYDESGLIGTNQVQYSALSDLLAPPGPVKHLTLINKTELDSSVVVSFSPPGSANFKTANIYRTDSGAPVLLGQSASGGFGITGLKGGEVLTVKVTSVSSLGGESNYLSAPTAQLVASYFYPPDVQGLVLEGERLRWSYPNPPSDLDGFLVRFRPGDATDWASATPAHAHVLKVTDFQIFKMQGTQTYLVKAVDLDGNESANAKAVTVDYDGVIIDNIVLVTDHRALGWPGTITNGSVIGGDIKADSSAVFWTSDAVVMWAPTAASLMWSAAYDEMSYEFTVTPTSDQLDAMLKLQLTMAGTWSIEYQAEPSATMWSTDAGMPMWAGDSLSMWTALSPYMQWPGQIDHLRMQPYRIKIIGYAGTVQAVLQQLSVIFDVRDLLETLENVPISAAGTRLALTQSYREIVMVRTELEEDGGSAAYVKVLDKNPTLGPLIKAYNSSNVATTAVIDAVVHGY